MSITTQRPSHHLSPLLPIQIEYQGRGFSARLGSLSPEGALLETHGLSIPEGMRVELCLTLARRPWQIQATITHTTPHEIGVLFHTPQSALYAALGNQLSAPPPIRWPKQPRESAA